MKRKKVLVLIIFIVIIIVKLLRVFSLWENTESIVPIQVGGFISPLLRIFGIKESRMSSLLTQTRDLVGIHVHTYIHVLTQCEFY